jgi:hypothetical protein
VGIGSDGGLGKLKVKGRRLIWRLSFSRRGVRSGPN